MATIRDTQGHSEAAYQRVSPVGIGVEVKVLNTIR